MKTEVVPLMESGELITFTEMDKSISGRVRIHGWQQVGQNREISLKSYNIKYRVDWDVGDRAKF